MTSWSSKVNPLTLPEPITAYLAAEHNPEALAHRLSCRLRLEQGLIASLEITA